MMEGLNGWKKMMTKKLFNSQYEIRLRMLLLLFVARQPLSADKITTLDFISVYGKDFEIGGDNIHGSSPYRFAEITNRRAMVSEAIKTNVMDGMLNVDTSEGYSYSLTERGKSYVDAFSCSYVSKYCENAKKAMAKYGNLSEAVLMKKIQGHCYELVEGGTE